MNCRKKAKSAKLAGMRKLFLAARKPLVQEGSSTGSAVYQGPTKALNQAVKRNQDKFPEDFLFRLARDEAGQVRRSRSPVVTLKRGHNLKYLPLAFTEHGASRRQIILSDAIPKCAASRLTILPVPFARARRP